MRISPHKRCFRTALFFGFCLIEPYKLYCNVLWTTPGAFLSVLFRTSETAVLGHGVGGGRPLAQPCTCDPTRLLADSLALFQSESCLCLPVPLCAQDPVACLLAPPTHLLPLGLHASQPHTSHVTHAISLHSAKPSPVTCLLLLTTIHLFQ